MRCIEERATAWLAAWRCVPAAASAAALLCCLPCRPLPAAAPAPAPPAAAGVAACGAGERVQPRRADQGDGGVGGQVPVRAGWADEAGRLREARHGAGAGQEQQRSKAAAAAGKQLGVLLCRPRWPCRGGPTPPACRRRQAEKARQREAAAQQQVAELEAQLREVRGRVEQRRADASSQASQGAVVGALMEARRRGEIEGIHGRLGELGRRGGGAAGRAGARRAACLLPCFPAGTALALLPPRILTPTCPPCSARLPARRPGRHRSRVRCGGVHRLPRAGLHCCGHHQRGAALRGAAAPAPAGRGHLPHPGEAAAPGGRVQGEEAAARGCARACGWRRGRQRAAAGPWWGCSPSDVACRLLCTPESREHCLAAVPHLGPSLTLTHPHSPKLTQAHPSSPKLTQAHNHFCTLHRPPPTTPPRRQAPV